VPGQPSIGIKWQAKQQVLAPHGAAVAAAAATCSGAVHNAAAAAGPGALPDALTAAQLLLALGGVHVANVPGLGFTQVVSWLVEHQFFFHMNWQRANLVRPAHALHTCSEHKLWRSV
jgi:hypothetical protein